MRLEISGGPLGVKLRIQGHLGVGKGEKHPLGQNCPKVDATIKQVEKSLQFKIFEIIDLTYNQSVSKRWNYSPSYPLFIPEIFVIKQCS